MAAIRQAIGGAPFESLIRRQDDGVAIQPLYPPAASSHGAFRSKPGAWHIVQRIDHPDPDEARSLLQEDRRGGATGFLLVANTSPCAFGFGFDPHQPGVIEQILGDVDLASLHLRLSGDTTGKATESFLAFCGHRGLGTAALDIELGFEPIAGYAFQAEPEDNITTVMALAVQMIEAGFRHGTLSADGRGYHAAGASQAQELAIVIATALAYLRLLTARGLDLETARRALSFTLAADQEIFLTLAKFRALRQLWACVEEACGLAPRPVRLHAETSWRMMTRRDPWSNVLRTTLAAFAAGLGGADSVSILPLTAAHGLPDAEARRLARNTQHVLLAEAHLAEVLDPAAGSGAFEALTQDLAGAAWRLFQQIDAGGGIVESLRNGALQSAIVKTRGQRQNKISEGRAAIVGSTVFALEHEEKPSVLMPLRVPPQDHALAPFRLSQPFEDGTA